MFDKTSKSISESDFRNVKCKQKPEGRYPDQPPAVPHLAIGELTVTLQTKIKNKNLLNAGQINFDTTQKLQELYSVKFERTFYTPPPMLEDVY